MNDTIIKILKKVGAILTNDHFVLVSGRHSNAYVNPDKILPHTEINSQIGQLVAQKFKNIDVDVVIGPAYGGVIFSQWVAYHLSKIKGREIMSVFTDKTPQRNHVFERGFGKLVAGKKTLVIEDITVTGSSVKKVMKVVKKAGGIIVAVGVLVNRDTTMVNSKIMGAPVTSLSEYKLDSFDAKNCPLCRQKIPINPDIGHGKQYLEHLSKKS